MLGLHEGMRARGQEECTSNAGREATNWLRLRALNCLQPSDRYPFANASNRYSHGPSRLGNEASRATRLHQIPLGVPFGQWVLPLPLVILRLPLDLSIIDLGCCIAACCTCRPFRLPLVLHMDCRLSRLSSSYCQFCWDQSCTVPLSRNLISPDSFAKPSALLQQR